MNVLMRKLLFTPIHMKEMVSYLKTVDGDFSPPLSKQQPDLEKYAEKLLTKGDVWEAMVDNQSAGMIAVYANDIKNKFAYLSLLSVKSTFRNHGIAKLMLDEVFRFVRKKGMRTFCLESNNPIAIQLYEYLGFRISKEICVGDEKKMLMECTLKDQNEKSR
ncbi:GNAT family N-acetyltransferase [Hallella colorans]|uniref:GNAT family N-acetyltransferase n=1 Tax=Hallella colorans TaxID=1703337 RepID=UPI0023F454D4|nr:GNAT family N-acetyltransferase [Hallella colorans]